MLPQFTENDESESVEEVVLQSENVQMEGENPFESAGNVTSLLHSSQR